MCPHDVLFQYTPWKEGCQYTTAANRNVLEILPPLPSLGPGDLPQQGFCIPINRPFP